MSLSYESAAARLLCALSFSRLRAVGAPVGERGAAAGPPKSGRKVRRAGEPGLAADASHRQRAGAKQALGHQQPLLGQLLLEAFAERLLEDAREVVTREAGPARH